MTSTSLHKEESDARSLTGGGGELGKLKTYYMASTSLHKVN
jgi:hypothetical protein